MKAVGGECARKDPKTTQSSAANRVACDLTKGYEGRKEESAAHSGKGSDPKQDHWKVSSLAVA